jgi:triosephosphate isomerase (TIM)
MEKPLVVANWKMNPQKEEEAVKIANFSDKDGVVVCPPSVFLSKIRLKKAKLGAQNCFFEKKGAFTGEVSPEMLKNYGCQYVIVGHSERRKFFSEGEESIKRKIEVLLKENITPILCVGEEVKEELRVLEGVSLKKVVIAYEPEFAIGTGNSCDSKEAEKRKVLIKSILVKNNQDIKGLKILYGGSVDSKNALSYIKKAGFDGLLVGGASIKEGEFEKLLNNLSI